MCNVAAYGNKMKSSMLDMWYSATGHMIIAGDVIHGTYASHMALKEVVY